MIMKTKLSDHLKHSAIQEAVRVEGCDYDSGLYWDNLVFAFDVLCIC